MSYRNLNNMLRTIETKLNTTGNTNFYESRIKQDLPFFKEQSHKKTQEAYINGNDTYINTQPMNVPSMNYTINHNPETNEEVRRAIKREIDPFLFGIKNELNLTMEAFRKEIESYTQFKPEIEECKEMCSINSKLIQISQEETEKKLIANNQKISGLSRQIEDMKCSSDDLSRRFTEMEKIMYDFSDKLSQCEKMKHTIENVDSNLGKIYKEIEESLTQKFTSKFSNIEKQVEISKKENTAILTQMTSLSINQSQYDIHLNDKQRFINELSQDMNELKIKANTTIVLLTDTTNKVDNYNALHQALDGKFQNINKQINSQNENISTVQLGFKALANEYLQIKSQFNDINDQMNKEQNQRTMIQNELGALAITSNNHNERILKLTSQLNESINVTNSALYGAIIEKINKCQMNIDEVSDVSNGKIASINSKIGDLSVGMKELAIPKKQYGYAPIEQSYSGNNPRDINNEEFKSEQIKYNDLYEKTLNEISKQLRSLGDDVKALQDDAETYEDNFSKVQDNFIKINPQLDKITILEKNITVFPELIKTISSNHEILQEDVQKGFNSMTKWQSDLIENINNTIENLKNDLENKMKMEKIANTMNRQHNIDSERITMTNDEMMIQLNNIENAVKDQQLSIGKLNSRFVEKYQFDKVNSKCDAIEAKVDEIDKIKIPQVYTYINNTLNEIIDPKSSSINRINNAYDQFSEGSSRKNDLGNINSMRNNNTGALSLETGSGNLKSMNPASKKKTENEEMVKEKNNKAEDIKETNEMIADKGERIQELMSLYPQGYINNNNKGTSLIGDGLDIAPKLSDSMVEMSKPKNTFYSNNNFVDVFYTKLSSGEKAEKNSQYLSLQAVDLIQNKNNFSENYLKNYMIPRLNVENILEIEFDENVDSERDEDIERDLDNPLQKSDNVLHTKDSCDPSNLFKNESISGLNNKSNNNSNNKAFVDDFDDDDDEY